MIDFVAHNLKLNALTERTLLDLVHQNKLNQNESKSKKESEMCVREILKRKNRAIRRGNVILNGTKTKTKLN